MGFQTSSLRFLLPKVQWNLLLGHVRNFLFKFMYRNHWVPLSFFFSCLLFDFSFAQQILQHSNIAAPRTCCSSARAHRSLPIIESRIVIGQSQIRPRWSLVNFEGFCCTYVSRRLWWDGPGMYQTVIDAALIMILIHPMLDSQAIKMKIKNYKN